MQKRSTMVLIDMMIITLRIKKMKCYINHGRVNYNLGFGAKRLPSSRTAIFKKSVCKTCVWAGQQVVSPNLGNIMWNSHGNRKWDHLKMDLTWFNHLFPTETIPEKRKTQTSKCSFLGILLVHFFRFWVQKAAMPKSLTGNPQPENFNPSTKRSLLFWCFSWATVKNKTGSLSVHGTLKKRSKHNGW